MNQFGNLLRELRLRRGHTRQNQAAAACGLSSSYWSKLEGGRLQGRPPSLEVIHKIATGLDLSQQEHGALLQASGQDTPIAHLEIVRKLLQVLRDDSLRRDVEAHLHQDIDELVTCWSHYAEAKERQYERKWEEAAKLCAQAHAKIQQLAAHLSTYLLDTRAAALLHRNRLEEVAAVHQAIEANLDPTQDPYIAALTTMHRGDHRRVCDAWDEAKSLYISAQDRFRTLPDRARETARCERKIATVYLHQGDWQQARVYLDSAHATFEELYTQDAQSGEYELARTLYVMGWAFNLGGNWQEAERHHQRGFDLARNFTTQRKQSDQYLIMLGHSYLATDMRQRQSFEDAQAHYDKALQLCEELQAAREKPWIYLGLARQAAQQAQAAAGQTGSAASVAAYRQQAAAHFEDARAAAQATGSKYQQTMILNHAGHMALAEKSEAGNQRALDLLNQALRLATELGTHYYVASVKRQMCEIYWRREHFGMLTRFAHDVEELHRRFHYDNHMAWVRATEAKAMLAQQRPGSAPARDWQAIAGLYAAALAHGLNFNQHWANEVLKDFDLNTFHVPPPARADLIAAVDAQLAAHPDIRPYAQDVIARCAQLRTKLQGLA